MDNKRVEHIVNQWVDGEITADEAMTAITTAVELGKVQPVDSKLSFDLMELSRMMYPICV